jgi:hypothetical protein
MVTEAETMTAPMADVLHRLDRLAAEVAAVREELSRLKSPRPISAQVVEWAQKVNAAIDDPTLKTEDRTKVIENVPAPLRHAVAAECYRTNENITIGWVATIARVFTWEVPDLLQVFDIEPDETPMTAEEMDEQVALIRQHRYDSTRQ